MIKDLEAAVITKLVDTTYSFENIFSTLEMKTQQSKSFLNSNATDALYSQGFRKSISNDDELNDHTVKRRKEKKNKNNMSKSILKGCMSNLPSLLGVDNDINTLTIRDNQYSKITDMKKTTGLNNI